MKTPNLRLRTEHYLDSNDWQLLLSRLVEKEISKVWRGYGTTIFFEIGSQNKQGKGEVTLQVNGEWNLVKDGIESISSKAKNWGDIDLEIRDLRGKRVNDFVPLGEAIVSITPGGYQLLIGSSMDADQLSWLIHFRDAGIYVSRKTSVLYNGKWD